MKPSERYRRARWMPETILICGSMLAALCLQQAMAQPAEPSRTVRSAPVRAPHVTAELVMEQRWVRPGAPFRVALKLTMEDGWHTYWKNPGDAGLATSIEWSLPPGFVADSLQWPCPESLGEPPEVTYGYSNEVLLVATITPPADLGRATEVTLGAEASWLVCNQVCIPGRATLRLNVPVFPAAPATDPEIAREFARTDAAMPVKSADVRAGASVRGDTIELRVEGLNVAGAAADAIMFFSEEESLVDHSAPQTARVDRGVLVLTLRRSPYNTEIPTVLRGYLASRNGWPPQGVRALLVRAPIGGASGR